jgi:hypothetical protein
MMALPDTYGFQSKRWLNLDKVITPKAYGIYLASKKKKKPKRKR